MNSIGLKDHPTKPIRLIDSEPTKNHFSFTQRIIHFWDSRSYDVVMAAGSKRGGVLDKFIEWVEEEIFITGYEWRHFFLKGG